MCNARECGIFLSSRWVSHRCRGPIASAMPAIQLRIASAAIRCDYSHGMERGLHFIVIPLHATSQLVSAFEWFDRSKEDVKCLPV